MPAEFSVATSIGDAPPPADWREATLSSVAEVRFSSVDKITRPSEEPVRLCNYVDVYENNYITGDLEFMQASATQPEIARFGLQVGDVIITKDSETPDDIGIPAVVDYAAPDLVCGYHLGLIRPNHDEVDSTFLAKQLGNSRVARYFGRQANGLTRYGLPIGAVNNTPLWLPEATQQRAIGIVLRLIDGAIAKTKAVSAKLNQVRAGLLHDLLTLGLDEHGQLRDPIGNPEQFKGSPLGRIPREWEVRVLKHLVQSDRRITYGIVQPGDFDPHGILLIRGQDYMTGWSQPDSMFRVAPALHQLYRRSLTRAGDLLISIVGAPGLVTQVPPWIVEANITQTTARVACDASKLDARFGFNAISSELVQRQVRSFIKGSAQPGLNLQDVELLQLQVPSSSDEQREIASRLDQADAAIQAEHVELLKLRELRAGLMADLLTGRVRVPESLNLAKARP